VEGVFIGSANEIVCLNTSQKPELYFRARTFCRFGLSAIAVIDDDYTFSITGQIDINFFPRLNGMT
jgi:hypothetical protein